MLCNHHNGPHVERPFACSCVETFDAIVAGEEIPKLAGYCAIVRAAAQHPDLLTSFASDLITHDRAELTDYSGVFLWVLRECGTVLLKPSTERGALTVRGILTAFGEDGRWYWFDGRALRQVDARRASELVEDALESTCS